ncbi:hypothetical protein [Rubellicoccus peritrichatus]|uniref:Uncharacterized protein n=1 Tax=Rubellicoccus peritrichatus TaxID=3080537 RepID=A0AAQ3LCA1_9BACT|nr:hypothetical protein [Puniceicoccus sp. CR14]WOO42717.1 hypothetical protein RZN69_06405 [Puniceicoccus sp. CR14]
MKHTLLSLLLATAVGAISTSAYGAASGEHTAAHVKAHADEYVGENVTLDVVYIRINNHTPPDVPYVFFRSVTIDEDAHARGGSILTVADADDKQKLIRRFGTNLDRKGFRDIDVNKMRGVVRVVEREDRPRVIYLDLTEEGVDLSNAPEVVLDGEIGPRRPSSGGSDDGDMDLEEENM